jgi:DNA-binding XRE family transcriptional regulator
MKTVTADPFRLHRVNVLDGHRLELVYADGKSFTVDLSPWLQRTKALAALRDEATFALATVGHFGTAVCWGEEIDLGADNLRNLAVEQAGGIGHERLVEWMARNNLTQEAAAKAIGISRRMLNYYRSGARVIPKTVWLACIGWETTKDRAAA